MHRSEIDPRVGELESAGRSSSDPAAVLDLLASLDRMEIPDATLLARFHDALLFLCAYPATPQIARRAESILKRFFRRVEGLARTENISLLLDPEVSGIAGTWVEVVFSYDFVRWLVRRFPGELEIDWDNQAASESLASILTQLLPFLEEEASVDANVPYAAWLEAARATAKDGGLAWLLRSVEQLPLPADRAALYDSLGLSIRWKLGNSAMTRTLMRRRPGILFYQQTPLLSRSDVSIAREIAGEPLRVSKLSRREGAAVLDMARAAMAMRYRELYGFTWGDPSTILSADAGRGLEILLVGIVPERRLPLRAGFATLILRNGVPIGYADAFGLCERMEVSFNIFYAFRDGESAFCFARLLTLYHQLFGSTSFSIDPYQIGAGNDEAIEAGAFWFYRKLGFRSTNPHVERIAHREEERMANEPRHRTSARMLRRMARSPLLYDADSERLPLAGWTAGFEPARVAQGEWDRFHIRNIGLAVERRFADRGQSAAAFTESSLDRVAAELRMSARSLSLRERRALGRLAPVLALIPDLRQWSAEERAGVREIIRAKAGRREERYLHLLTRHDRLRRAVLKLGS